jgi:hypothetical protein
MPVSFFVLWACEADDTQFVKGGVGFITALWMKALKLETVTDEVYKTASVVCAKANAGLIAIGHSGEKTPGRGDNHERAGAGGANGHRAAVRETE